jgi:hypothetical protein
VLENCGNSRERIGETARGVHLGWLKLEGLRALIGSIPSVAIFTLLAVVELVADKLPRTPSRTSPPGLIPRISRCGSRKRTQPRKESSRPLSVAAAPIYKQKFAGTRRIRIALPLFEQLRMGKRRSVAPSGGGGHRTLEC